MIKVNVADIFSALRAKDASIPYTWSRACPNHSDPVWTFPECVHQIMQRFPAEKSILLAC